MKNHLLDGGDFKTMSKKVVISIGGSLIVTDRGIDVSFLKKIKQLIATYAKKNYTFYLVIGGGKTARNYIQAAKQTSSIGNSARDWLGISATRLNAQLLQTVFGSLAHSEIITDPTQKIKTTKKVVLAAGYKPGWSTDYVAVLLAKNNSINTVINLSNIDYVYCKDPRKYPDAKKLKKVSWVDFQKIVGTKWRPGLNAPFDPIASLLARKNKLEVVIMNGSNIKNLQQCLEDKKFKGTVIS